MNIINSTTFIISLFAVSVSIAAIYYSRKSAQSHLLSHFIEKESIYISEWNNPKNTDEVDEDLKWKYINLLETISLFHNQNEVSKNLTRRYFINIYKDIYVSKKIDIETKIINGDFKDLNKVLIEWGIKKT